MTPYFLIIFGFILMALEMVMGSGVFDFFILGIIFVISGSVGVYMGNELLAYALIGLFSIVFLLWGRPLLIKKLGQKITASNSDALIGKEAIVKSWNEKEGSGQIEVGHELWLAKGPGNYSKNDKVIVEKINGNTLIVKK